MFAAVQLPVPVDFSAYVELAISNLTSVVAAAIGAAVVLTAFAKVRMWVVLPMQQKLAAEATTKLLNNRKAWKNVGTRKVPVYELSEWGKEQSERIESARTELRLSRSKRGKIRF